MKTALKIITFIALAMNGLVQSVQAQSDYTYSDNGDGTCAITGYTGSDVAVTIPNMLNGLTVVSIGNNAFYYTSLTSVTIPGSITNIGSYAFEHCASLSTVAIPRSVSSIGDGTFEFCSSLDSVTIGSGVTRIGRDTFEDCTSLISITIPDSVTSIGDDAFGGCRGLTSFTVPDSVTSIGDDAFGGCTGLTSVAIANSVTSIGSYAFDYCTRLASVTIPSSVSSIGDGTFEFCSSLISITIPDSVTNIGSDVFAYCSGLTNILVDAANTFYSSTNGVLFDKNQTTLIEFPPGLGGGYTIPNMVTSVGSGAFATCTRLTSVTIPDSITNIESYAFSGCTGLTSVAIANGVTTIGDDAFATCLSLTSVMIPNSVTTIGFATFYNCMSLTSVIIGRGVTSIGSGGFEACPALASVWFQGNAPSADDSTFFGDAINVFYNTPGTTGWAKFFHGIPTAQRYLPNPQILNFEPNFGVHINQFGFVISWATNVSVVVEASMNPADQAWQPVQTNTLVNGSFYFGDSQWTNYPGRFYRVRSK